MRSKAPLAAAALLLCTLACPAPAAAQSTEPAPGRVRSVYDLRFAQDLTLSGIAAVGLAFPYLFDDRLIFPRCPCDEREVNGLDRLTLGLQSQPANVASDVLVTLAVTVPVVLDVLALGFGETLWEDLLVYAESLLFSGALVSWTKAVVARPLPVVYSGKDLERAGQASGYRSFYSGHAAMTATALTAAAFTVHLRYGDGTLAYWTAVGATSLVGTLKILAGEHFITDVLLGGLFGAVVGMTVPMIHRRIGDPAKGALSLSLAPVGSGVEAALLPALTWRQRF